MHKKSVDLFCEPHLQYYSAPRSLGIMMRCGRFLHTNEMPAENNYEPIRKVFLWLSVRAEKALITTSPLTFRIDIKCTWGLKNLWVGKGLLTLLGPEPSKQCHPGGAHRLKSRALRLTQLRESLERSYRVLIGWCATVDLRQNIRPAGCAPL
jgi:hypothetical protein